MGEYIHVNGYILKAYITFNRLAQDLAACCVHGLVTRQL